MGDFKEGIGKDFCNECGSKGHEGNCGKDCGCGAFFVCCGGCKDNCNQRHNECRENKCKKKETDFYHEEIEYKYKLIKKNDKHEEKKECCGCDKCGCEKRCDCNRCGCERRRCGCGIFGRCW